MTNWKHRIPVIDNVRSLQLFQIIRYGSSILIQVLLTKSYLSLDEIGVFETLMWISTMLSFFWVSGFLKGILPVYPNLAEPAKRRFLFNVFLLFLGAAILITGLFWIFRQPVLLLLTEKDELPYLGLLCLYLLINTPTYLVEYIYLLHDKPKWIIRFGLFAFGGSVLAVSLPVLLGYDLRFSFIGLLLLGITKFFWLVALLYRHGDWKLDRKLVTPYVWLSIPLILNMMVSGSAEYVDGIIVHRYFDEGMFAIFRYGARELPLSLALSTAMGAALIPKLAANFSEGLQELRLRSGRLMHILFGVSILLMLTSPFFFPIVFNPQFSESAVIFNIYLLILSSRLLFPQTVLIALKRTRIILGISLLELFLNVSLSLVFVQFWGIEGIAWATVIAYLIDKILLCIYLYWKEGVKLLDYLKIRTYLVYSLLLVLSYWLSTFY